MAFSTSRVNGIIVAFLGRRQEVMQDIVEPAIRTQLSIHQRKRLDSAVSESFRVYPRSAGQFTVYSPAPERESVKTYTVDTTYEDAQSCTCSDFAYRCDLAADELCKHLWRVTLLRKLDVLPTQSIDPYDWLLDELARDAQLLSNRGPPDTTDSTPPQLSSLREEVRSTEREEVDFERICVARANLLKRLL